MKKYIYLLSCLLVFAAGCKNEEKDLFPRSSAERLNEALSMDKALLCAAPNGWVIEYFATDESVGYPLLAKFLPSGAVTIAAKNELLNNKYTVEESLYAIIGDNGPVLTFNSYNPVLHIFSNPEDISTTKPNENGYGYKGDYEFIFMQTDSNPVLLQGKKRGTNIILKELPENITWEAYIAKLEEINSNMFSSKNPTLFLISGTDTLFASDGYTHKFSLLKRGGDPVSETKYAPFIITDTGIRFHSPIKLGNSSAQTFTLNEDKSKLECANNGSTMFMELDMSSYFMDNKNSWTFSSEQMGTAMSEAYKNIVTNCKKKLKENFKNLSIKYIAKQKSKTLSFKSGEYNGVLNLEILVSEKKNKEITFKFKNTYDTNGKYYYNNIGGFKEFVAALQSTFVISSEAPLVSSLIKFVDNKDATNWFIVKQE